ncbi:MAG: tRNA uridine-5-carboxymethylaminomethyl(34) synthesis GTPase MnmE [Armatimonadetes bacterium]|nr:tRNA uridine-5-carboxymethylaminomethyl(34) synthesis GTPase MnmE [Armatimonadota bacterium]
MFANDTIAAIATARGEAAIGIVRVSGPATLALLDRLFHHAGGVPASRLAARTAHLGEIREPASGRPVDQVVLILYRAPRSYTGEDAAEICGHGGAMPLGRILSLALAHGARPARPGEFTCRAFLNGKLDLAQAEAVVDVVQARTEPALTLAVRQLEGRLSALVRRARDAVLPVVAHVEATIDFPEDVPELPRPELDRRIAAAAATVESLLAGARAGRIYREGARVVIAGRPNVGKSSLLNALLREDRAIVTDIPGTTRDVIEESATIRGIPIRTIDTAGIRPARDPIEAIGVERALAQIADADLVLAVLDASQPLGADDRTVLVRARGRPAVVILNKRDLPELRVAPADVAGDLPGAPVVAISALQGTGIAELEEEVAATLLGGRGPAGDDALVTSARHQAALEAAAASLREARATLTAGIPLDLVVTDLRGALAALGQITGESASDAVLADIFGRFCIGK